MIQEGPIESPKGLKPSPPENSGLCLETLCLAGFFSLTVFPMSTSRNVEEEGRIQEGNMRIETGPERGCVPGFEDGGRAPRQGMQWLLEAGKGFSPKAPGRSTALWTAVCLAVGTADLQSSERVHCVLLSLDSVVICSSSSLKMDTQEET